MPSSNRKTEIRIRDVERIAARADDSDTPALLACLRDPSSYVAKIAADALCDRAGRALAERLITEYEYFEFNGTRRDSGCYIRAALARLFTKLEYGPAREALKRGIRTVQIESVAGVPYDMAGQLRGECALGLAEMRDPQALRYIAPLLFDDGCNGIVKAAPVNAELRVIAARAIGRLGNPDGLAVLGIVLGFPDREKNSEVLCECMSAAMQLDAQAALPLVTAYIESGYRDLYAPAAIAIINSGITGAEDYIASAISTSRGDSLKAICLTLAAKRTASALDTLNELASSDSDEHRTASAYARAAVGC